VRALEHYDSFFRAYPDKLAEKNAQCIDSGLRRCRIVWPHSGAGSMPCSLRIRWMVDRPRPSPRFSIAPRRRV